MHQPRILIQSRILRRRRNWQRSWRPMTSTVATSVASLTQGSWSWTPASSSKIASVRLGALRRRSVTGWLKLRRGFAIKLLRKNGPPSKSTLWSVRGKRPSTMKRWTPTIRSERRAPSRRQRSSRGSTWFARSTRETTGSRTSCERCNFQRLSDSVSRMPLLIR